MGKWDRPRAEDGVKKRTEDAAQAVRRELDLLAERTSPEDAAFDRIEQEGKMLDLHGEAQDMAWSMVLDFLAEQSAMGVEGVKILHGHGKGILKRMLLQKLPKDPRIEAIQLPRNTWQREVMILVLFRQREEKK